MYRGLEHLSFPLVFFFMLATASDAATLVHHWAFDGNTKDSSGSGNDGDVFGQITYTAGVSGQALLIDELDDLVENEDAKNLPIGAEDLWTLNVWYNLESFPSLAYGGGYGGRIDDGRVRSFLSFGPGGGHEDNAFYFWGSNIDVYADESYDTDGKWHMYTISWDGEEIRMYEDAKLVINTDADKQGNLIVEDLAARGDIEPIVSVGGPSHWNQNILGAVDEFRIFNGALTDAEITALFSPAAGTPGDFDGDGALTAADIDALSADVRAGTNTKKFDVTGDNLVNAADRSRWVSELKKTYLGDSNLDREFNSGDFVAVFTVGEYEDATNGNSGWADGDWDGDGDFTSGDFVGAFTEGGYEKGPQPSVAGVPEPSGLVMVVLGMFWVVHRRTHFQT